MARLVARWLSPEAEIAEDDTLEPGTVRVTLGADFEHVAEPGEPEPDAADRGGEGAVDPSGGDGAATAVSAPASTTTTTQPGWVPGTPPAGISCP